MSSIHFVNGGGALRIAVGITMLALLLAGGARAATITVNASGGADYTRIQDAINNSNNGDTITVAAGTYYENVVVNKSVSMVGAGANVTIVNANNSSKHVFNVTANYVNISGFTATGATGYNEIAGIYLSGVNYVNVSNNIASNNSYGIYLSYSDNNNLTSNNASNHRVFGIFLTYSKNNKLISNNASNNEMGIGLGYSGYNTVSSNSVNSNIQAGLYLSYSAYNIITNSLIKGNVSWGNNWGIYLLGSNWNTIIYNNVSNSRRGVYMFLSESNTLRNNMIYDNLYNFGDVIFIDSTIYNNIDTSNFVDGKPIYYLVGASGIVIDSSSNAGLVYCIKCDNITIKGLMLTKNRQGIYFHKTNNSKIQNNHLSYNEAAIDLISSSNNTVYNNYFNNTNNLYFNSPIYSNILNISKQSGTNIIDGFFLGGNFWANPSGTGLSQTCMDINIDGICDTNYTLNSLNIDYLPLATPDTTNPTIVISSPANNTILNISSINILGISSDTRSGIQKVEVQVDEETFNSATGTTSWTYSTTSLSDGLHRITARATDNASNNATTSINITIDTTPPATITNLVNVTYASTYINWTWTPPQDSDFSKVMIYLNGIFQTNVSKGVQYFKAVGLTTNTTYEISTRTVDNVGNINLTWMNSTSTTNPIITVNASGGADYKKIQDAIYNASNWDTIIVSAGTYNENLKVNRSVTLIGAGAKITVVQAANSNDHVFNVTVNNVNITGFKVTGATTNPKAGIYFYNSSNNNIKGNNASNNYYGVYLYSSSNNSIDGNFFSNTNNYGFGGSIYNNYWNITKKPGINIAASPFLGGNFWAYPNGTGFSQTCADSNKDGICDSSYTLTSGNVDYIPLAAIPSGYGYISGTVLNGTGVTSAIVSTNTNNITTTDASGIYALLVPAGMYNLTVTKEPEYYSNTSVVVTAISGTTIILQDIELIRKPTGNITGRVTS